MVRLRDVIDRFPWVQKRRKEEALQLQAEADELERASLNGGSNLPERIEVARQIRNQVRRIEHTSAGNVDELPPISHAGFDIADVSGRKVSGGRRID